MEILRFARHKLLAVLRANLGARYAERFESPRALDVVGVFFENRSKWYLGVRVKNHKRHTLYIRMKVERRGIAFTLVVWPSFEPFNWRHYRADEYQGDNPPAYARLKARADRKHKEKASG